jgi:preprotein translocase subunit YajC
MKTDLIFLAIVLVLVIIFLILYVIKNRNDKKELMKELNSLNDTNDIVEDELKIHHDED